jgi:hypothetical protein
MQVDAPSAKMIAEAENDQVTLDLTEEEALTLLIMCMLSPVKLDPVAEGALWKLTEFCRSGRAQSTKNC